MASLTKSHQRSDEGTLASQRPISQSSGDYATIMLHMVGSLVLSGSFYMIPFTSFHINVSLIHHRISSLLHENEHKNTRKSCPEALWSSHGRVWCPQPRTTMVCCWVAKIHPGNAPPGSDAQPSVRPPGRIVGDRSRNWLRGQWKLESIFFCWHPILWWWRPKPTTKLGWGDLKPWSMRTLAWRTPLSRHAATPPIFNSTFFEIGKWWFNVLPRDCKAVMTKAAT